MIAVGSIRAFGRAGAIVGRFPLVCLLVGFFLTLPGLAGLFFRLEASVSQIKRKSSANFRFHLDTEFDAGFVRSNAPSHHEIAVQQSFFGRKGEKHTFCYPSKQSRVFVVQKQSFLC